MPVNQLDGEPAIDWVIVGGESGPPARPCHVDWIASIVEECREGNVPCFVKQLGSRPFVGGEAWRDGFDPLEDGELLRLADRKGGNIDEWPEALRVREFPLEVAKS